MKIASVGLMHSKAGPSPLDNNRVEIFFAGCKKARENNPCKGCFNQDLWYDTSFGDVSLEEVVEDIKSFNNPYISIFGGEPLDQYEDLLSLCKELKKDNFHIILFTHYTMHQLNNCDVIVDGEYIEKYRTYNESFHDGFHDVIGSANQVVWDCSDKENLVGHATGTLFGLKITEENKLEYIFKL